MGERSRRPPVVALVVVLAAAFVVCWWRLGIDPIHRTEGHRAIPAWTILETGEWFPTRLFGTVYLNKPPGMPWAIALSSSVFGESAWAARAVSAASITALALAACWFSARWFGRRWALAGGLGTLVIPGYWAIARSADIEALLCLATGLSVFGVIELGAAQPRSAAARLVAAKLIAAGIVLGVLAKGPAIALPVLGAVAGACVGGGGFRALRSGWLWAGIAVGGAAVGGLAWWLMGMVPADEASRGQSGAEFLWRDGVARTLLYPPGALALGLPVALALVFPWGPDARREVEAGTVDARALGVARSLAAACFATLLIGAAIGLSNPRYGLPALMLAGPLVAYVAAGAAGGFDRTRGLIARIMLLGRGRVWVVGLVLGAGVYAGWVRPSDPDRRAGRSAAAVLAPALEDGDRVASAAVAYATPEIPHAMIEMAQRAGASVEVRWFPGGVPLDGPWSAFLLREDEWRRLGPELGASGWRAVAAAAGPGSRDVVVVRRDIPPIVERFPRGRNRIVPGDEPSTRDQ